MNHIPDHYLNLELEYINEIKEMFWAPPEQLRDYSSEKDRKIRKLQTERHRKMRQSVESFVRSKKTFEDKPTIEFHFEPRPKTSGGSASQSRLRPQKGVGESSTDKLTRPGSSLI